FGLGKGAVNVYGLKDWRKIIEAEDELRKQCVKDPPESWKEKRDMAVQFCRRLKDGRFLPYALQLFAQERPKDTVQVEGFHTSGYFRPAHYDDPPASAEWPGGRSLQEVGKPLFDALPQVRPQRLHKAKMFLLFVLTRPKYGISRPVPGRDFPMRTFRRFLEE